MRLFAVGLGIAGWLCSGIQLLSPVMAQTTPCNFTASSTSALIPSSYTSFGRMPQKVESAESSFEVTCSGDKAQDGNITLSINSLTSTTYGRTPQFEVIRAEGIFTPINNTIYNNSTPPISFAATPSTRNKVGIRTGWVYYRVLVAAPSGEVLRSAPNYTVMIKADLTLIPK